MKAYKSVPHWKHFSCQNVKTGNIFNINLFPRLLFTFSVSVRNVFDAVQICPISSLSPSSQLSDEASWALALFPACCQPDLSSQCVYHCFFQHHLPGATYQLTSGYSRLFCFLHFLSVSLSLSSLDAPLAPRPVTEGSYFHAGICFWCLMTNPRQPPLLEKKPVP